MPQDMCASHWRAAFGLVMHLHGACGGAMSTMDHATLILLGVGLLVNLANDAVVQARLNARIDALEVTCDVREP